MLESSFLDIIQEMKKRVGLATISTIVQRKCHSLQSHEKRTLSWTLENHQNFLIRLTNIPMQNFVHEVYDMQQ